MYIAHMIRDMSKLVDQLGGIEDPAKSHLCFS
jgi:hypothetical protein